MAWRERLLGAAGALCLASSGLSSRVTFRIQPVILCDDDGSRPSPVTAAQIQLWVKHANLAWKTAGISIALDAAPVTVRSTLLNGMMGEDGERWEAARNAANRLAGRYPARLVVLFRHGPGAEPTGRSFSWSDVNFVAMGSFESSRVCGRDNLYLLAHEIGHYLGLPHTFDRTFKSTDEAERHYRSGGGKPPGTAPFIRDLQCEDNPTVTLAGGPLVVDRDNLMSYYGRVDLPRKLTSRQAVAARRVAELRLRSGGPLPSYEAAPNMIEAETLVRRRLEGVTVEAAPLRPHWSGGRFLFCRSLHRGALSLDLPVERPGKYRIEYYPALGPDYGNLKVSLDGRRFPVLVRGWAPISTPGGRHLLGVRKLTAGIHTLRIEVAGKDETSLGYHFGVDGVRLLRQ